MNAQSVSAGYLRVWLLGLTILGLCMAGDAIAGVSVCESDRLAVAATGAVIYAGAGIAWLWSMFLLGAGKPEGRRMTPSGKSAAGAVGLGVCLLATWLICRMGS